MATLSHSSTNLSHLECEAEGSGRLMVTWAVSASALRSSRQAASLLNGHAAEPTGARLVWDLPALHDGNATAYLELSYGACETPERFELTPSAGVQVCFEHDDDADLDHMTVGESTEASASVTPRLTAVLKRGELMYAATDLLHALGLPGGVYDGPVCE